MDPKDLNMPQETLPISTELIIPEISEERLRELYSRIKPLVEEKDGNKYTLEEFTPKDLREISYYWNHEKNRKDIIDTNDLETIQDFPCLHTWGYYGLFKPSIAEVLSQMPEDVAEEADFFEIVEWPKDADDLNKQKEILNAGFHLSRVRAYRLKTEE
jgi:hypothetical protein